MLQIAYKTTGYDTMFWAGLVALIAAVGYYSECMACTGLAAIAFTVAYVVIFHWYEVRLVLRNTRRDLSQLGKVTAAGIRLRRWQMMNMTVVEEFARVVKRTPDKVMFLYGEEKWTYRQADEFTNRLANHFTAKGLKAGDDVAVMMGNCPEMVLTWLGLAKIGVASALINYNLKKTPLQHSISTVKAKAVIFTTEMIPALIDVLDGVRQINSDISFHCYGQHENLEAFPAENLQQSIQSASAVAPRFRGNIRDPLLYVFTSGTTGLPKAAIIKNYRFFLCALVGRELGGVREDDVLYLYLPLYHSAGGILGASQAILNGNTTAIAPKFSASRFWDDCIKYRCTVTQYIGEICRYLYMQPAKETDRSHSIRLMYGNGLRPQLWPRFIERFGIAEIKEFYGSTEGNGNLMNMDNRVGSIGFVPVICRFSQLMSSLVWHRQFIKVDSETGEPLRGENGLCILAGPNEPGELIAEIDMSKPETAFDGYTDKSATTKKIYSDVVRKGDRYFGSGDIMVYDDDGYIYFKDRTGDTFRWKGENVSTTEVESIVNKYAVESHCVVFGVEVPNTEGKAGMMAIHDEDGTIDLQRINDLLVSMRIELPAYAIPVFVRICSQIELTGSYKLPKLKLVHEAFNIKVVHDPIFILHPAKKQYVPFDENLHSELLEGKLRM